MKRVCYLCKKVFGEKPPFEDKSETHGICEDCWPFEKVEIHRALKKLKDAGWTEKMDPYFERSLVHTRPEPEDDPPSSRPIRDLRDGTE